MTQPKAAFHSCLASAATRGSLIRNGLQGCRVDSAASEQNAATICCKHNNESSSFIKDRKFSWHN